MMIDADEILMVGGEVMTVLRQAGPEVAVLDIHHSSIAFIEREPRARCSRCQRRRVLYRIAVRSVGHPPTFTEARCAADWGISPEEA